MLHRLVSSLTYRAAKTHSEIVVDAASEQFAVVAYRRLRQMGFSPGGVIDIGAHQGKWAREVRQTFNAPILMIEARKEEKAYLDRTTKSLSKASYEICLLGSKPSEAVRFTVTSSGSSLFDEQSNSERSYETLPMIRLDDLMRSHEAVRPPFFLKLDVQGGELEVLRGGSDTLERSEVIQLEVPFLVYNKGAPTATEVINFMDGSGFVPFDVSGFVRPDGVSLAQIDILFVKKASPLRRKFFEFP